MLGFVGLDPNLVSHDVDVDERMVNALLVVPAKGDQFEAAALAIKDCFEGKFAVCIGNLGIDVEPIVR